MTIICHRSCRIAREQNAEYRFSKVVLWYLSCLRAAQLEMTAARKPFNPVLGETFKCFWDLKEGIVQSLYTYNLIETI